MLRSRFARLAVAAAMTTAGTVAVTAAPAHAATCHMTVNKPHLLGGDTVYGSITLSSCSRPSTWVRVAILRYELKLGSRGQTVGESEYRTSDGQKGVAYGCKGKGKYMYVVVGTQPGESGKASDSAIIDC